MTGEPSNLGEDTFPDHFGARGTFYLNNPVFCKTNSLGKNLDTRQKYYVKPWCEIPSEVEESH